MPYLMSRVNCTYDQISRALMARSAGSFLGACLAGVICEIFPGLVDLWIALSLILAAVCTAAAPWCTQLLHLAGALGGTGLARGMLSVGKLWVCFMIINVQLRNIFGRQSSGLLL